MKKTTRKNAPQNTRKRTTKKAERPAPAGLRLLFEALQNADFRSHYGWTYPDAFLGVPAAMRAVSEESGYIEFDTALKAAITKECPGGTWGPEGRSLAVEVPDVAMLGGFWAGVTVAWFAMRDLQGHGGGR
jgi:hypothetical protein